MNALLPRDAIAGYILCTTPRSGSTLLCRMLADTGRAGRPDSFFHKPQFMREWGAAWGLPVEGGLSRDAYDALYVQAALAAGRDGTPLFGTRLQQSYLAPLVAMLSRLHPGSSSDADRLSRAFGPLRYVHLTREDKVAQAVSLVKATQSGLWHRHSDGRELERIGPAREPVYDAAAIGSEVAALTRADRAWRAWFEQERIEPLRIVYEAFAREPAATLVRVCAELGVDVPDGDRIVPSTARLTDAVSLDWAERFRHDERSRPVP